VLCHACPFIVHNSLACLNLGWAHPEVFTDPTTAVPYNESSSPLAVSYNNSSATAYNASDAIAAAAASTGHSAHRALVARHVLQVTCLALFCTLSAGNLALNVFLRRVLERSVLKKRSSSSKKPHTRRSSSSSAKVPASSSNDPTKRYRNSSSKRSSSAAAGSSRTRSARPLLDSTNRSSVGYGSSSTRVSPQPERVPERGLGASHLKRDTNTTNSTTTGNSSSISSNRWWHDSSAVVAGAGSSSRSVRSGRSARSSSGYRGGTAAATSAAAAAASVSGVGGDGSDDDYDMVSHDGAASRVSQSSRW
jgi:hypothetical protein